MAHFAKIENNIVTQVIVVDNQFEEQGQDWINNELGLEGEWVQTSYNSNFRGNYAGFGYVYDRDNDVFYAPQPYPSWTLNEDWKWSAPIPYPEDGLLYNWDEEKLDWIKL